MLILIVFNYMFLNFENSQDLESSGSGSPKSPKPANLKWRDVMKRVKFQGGPRKSADGS